MKPSPLSIAVTVALVFVSSAAAADKAKAKTEGPPPAVGAILRVSKDVIEVADHMGAGHTFAVNAATKFGTATEPLTWSELEKDDQVIISYTGKDGDNAVATVIRELVTTRAFGTPPVAGEILAITPAVIFLREHDGREHAYLITAETKYGSKSEPQKLSDLEVGDHVILLYTRERGNKTVAKSIMEVPHEVKAKGLPPSAGEIISISRESIRIREHDRQEHVYVINAQTKFGSRMEPQKLADFAPGDYVVVRYEKDAGDKPVATVIRELPGHGHGSPK